MLDERTFFSSVLRTVKTTSALGRLTFKHLENQFKNAEDSGDFSDLLQTVLGQLKGPLMKIAQILSTVPGVLSPQMEKALQALTNQAPAMGPLFVDRRMTQEWGKNWKSQVKEFSMRPAFSASLGQVHRGRLNSGEEVALKLQYPAMESVVKTDLAYLAVFCKVYERYSGALLTKNIQQELRARLLEELDYKKEAQHIQWFSKALQTEEGICLPKVYLERSTKRLLALQWIEGQSILEFQNAPQKIRNLLAKRLFRAWWAPFYQAGLLHGDPHLGNYTVCPKTHTLNILDFGCVRVFPPAVVTGLFLLFQGLKENDGAVMRRAYKKLGFPSVTYEMMAALNLWARFLYQPFMEDKIQPLTKDPSSGEGRQIALKVHQLLKDQGGVMPPRTFVFLDRAAVGIGSAMIRLNVKMNWHRMFLELTNGLSEDTVRTKQKEILSVSQKTTSGS